jgi:hypothetical protein
MKDMSMMHHFLGQEVWQRTDEIFLSQGKHTVGILKKFSMTKCKTTVMDLKKMKDDDSDKIDPQLIGSLMYLVNTSLDSCYAVNELSQSMSQLRQTHWIVVKHVLRYIRDTVGYGLRYASSVNLSLQDMPIQIEQRVQWTRRAHLVVVLPWSLPWFPNAAGNKTMWPWVPQRQKYITVSVWSNVASQASDRFTWPWDGSYDDNQEPWVKLLENPVFPDGSKYDEMKYPYFRDMMQRKIVHMQYLPTHEQIADIFTKLTSWRMAP